MVENLPFEIPSSWSWARLSSISKAISAGGDKPEKFSVKYSDEFPIPVYSNGEKNDGLFGYTDKPKIIEPSLTVSGRGTIGFTCIRTTPYVPIVRLISVIPCDNISIYYLKAVFTILFEQGVGSSIPQLTVPMLSPKLIPIPPYNEQLRICIRIKQIFDNIKDEC